ncbi:MAG: hypothetical protein WBZ40_05910 [Acidimicrobiia bacterium]
MPQDLTSLASPEVILVAWGAGLALVSGGVALVRIVGPGFTWLTASVAALISLVGVFSEDPWWARVGLLLLALAVLWARNRRVAGLMQIAAAVAMGIQSAQLSSWIPVLSATLALGGVTGEMLLGHWYLIDPRLPRWALRALAVLGIAGLAIDTLVLSAAGLPGGGATIAYFVLMGTSAIMMGAVIAALRYPAYAGVMAATGLSYLAVLTTLGGVFLGRVLVAGLGPFSN